MCEDFVNTEIVKAHDRETLYPTPICNIMIFLTHIKPTYCDLHLESLKPQSK